MDVLGVFRDVALPTPVTELAGAGLWTKRDDLSHPLYGGNKVRKLTRFFDAARADGRSRIVTLGAAGSQQVVAVAVFAKHLGLTAEAVLVSQPDGEHGRRNLRAALGHGLRPFVAPAWAAAPVLAASRLGRDAYFVPLGGSNALGSLGFVDAARELAAQIEARVLPEPDEIVVPLGSGGTAAGLAVGLEAIGLRTKVVGVAVAGPVPFIGAMARRLTKATAQRVGMSRAAAARALARLVVEGRWLGEGYGHPTPEGASAIARAAAHGLALDPTYTAKAFAAALDRARAARGATLYWHTLSAAPMAPLLEGAPDELPPELARLFVRSGGL